jgi:hypothetical protein
VGMMQPGHPSVSDRDIAEDLLSSEKYVTDIYSKAVIESSDQSLRNTLQQIHSEMQHNAKRVYDYLNARGWYRPLGVDQQRMNELRATADETKKMMAGAGAQPGGFYGFQPGMQGGYAFGGYPQPTAGNLPGWARTEPGGRGQQQGAGGGPVGYWGAQPYGGGGGQMSLPGWTTQEMSTQDSPSGQPTRPKGQPEVSAFGGYAYGGGQMPGWATQETSMQDPGAGQPARPKGQPQVSGQQMGGGQTLPYWAAGETTPTGGQG